MTRWARLVAPGYPMHVTHRGHNRELTFRDDRDFAMFRDMLVDSSRQAQCAIHAYALMSNHVHLLITPLRRSSAANMMMRLGSRFVRYWNKRHHRSGTMWNGRYSSSIVDSDVYFLACCRYIDLNPVRAGIVADAAHYQWSSFARLAFGKLDPIISPHGTYLALASNEDSRQSAYRAFCGSETDVRAESALRVATRVGTTAGPPAFASAIGSLLHRKATRGGHGGDRRSLAAFRRPHSPISRYIIGH